MKTVLYKNVTIYYNMFGGDISSDPVFNKILSIGYELETHHIVKLTELSQTDENGSPILINTDTIGKDIKLFEAMDMDEDDKDYDDMMLKSEEVISEPTGDVNFKFDITNDISQSSALVIAVEDACTGVSVDSDTKNLLYTIQVAGRVKTYAVNFVFRDGTTKDLCSSFSGVEWISTFYKPQLHSNLILSTFVKTLETLMAHIDRLKMIHTAYLQINKNILNQAINPNEEQTSTDPPTNISVEGTDKFKLYKDPKSNLHYLLTMGDDAVIDDIHITPQMTFASKAYNVLSIVKRLCFYTEIDKKFDVMQCDFTLELVETVTFRLIQRHNTLNPDYAVTPETNMKLYNQAFNYIVLILYKLHVYYTDYLNGNMSDWDKDKNYFKDLLYLNSRHGNYSLYVELKKTLMRMFNIDEKKIVSMIKGFIIQHDILIDLLPDKVTIVVDGVKSITTIREKNNTISGNVFRTSYKFGVTDIRYGNPAASLASYFDFFENPTPGTNREETETDKILEDNLNSEGEPFFHDWLDYVQIDTFSTRMELKDDIVLIEFRGFHRVYSVLATSLFKSIQFTRTLHGFRKFVRMYNSLQKVVMVPRKTRKMKPKKTIPGKSMSFYNAKDLSKSMKIRSKK